jgi:23S rRNA pseudouridine1911/1915/1917 synthase
MDDLARLYATLTSHHWSFVWPADAPCPATLVEALKQKLPHIDPCSWETRLSWGGVYLNGRSKSSDLPLAPPCRVEYYEPKFPIESAHEFFPPLTEKSIVYEDDDLIAVYKPARLPCLPTREQRHFNLKLQLRSYLQSRGCETPPHLPSRVDTSVQGLVVASKSARMHRALQRIFEKRQIKKYYLLEVEGPVEWREITVDKPIGKDLRHAVLRKVDQENGKPSCTIFRFLYASSVGTRLGSRATSILEAQPLSGRTHQIRVHAMSLGKPIVGDNFYGGLEVSGLHLLSHRAVLWHPFKEQSLEIRLPDELVPAWIDLQRI